ncbi:MAG: NUDIX domain-containing protein, partial [Methanobacteriota archaeon]
PKGTLELGETDEEAAVREVHEETGLRVKLLRPLTEVRYAFYWPPDGVNVDKTVAYFLAAPIGGRVRPEPGFDE